MDTNLDKLVPAASAELKAMVADKLSKAAEGEPDTSSEAPVDIAKPNSKTAVGKGLTVLMHMINSMGATNG